MRILVTGSRTWTDEHVIAIALDDAIRDSDVLTNNDVTVVHGACPTGADAIADRLAYEADCHVERHPADWETHGKSAGFRRNQEMVALGADVCLAFIKPCAKPGGSCWPDARPHGSHGASQCASAAAKAGIPVRRYLA